MRYFLVIAALGCAHGTDACAQATANAVAGADNAFGFRSGDDSIGIYNESSVRGFNLETVGNYRVNGSYFVKSSGVSSFFLESTTVLIGYSTLGVTLPGPSGVVDFRLRDPARGEPSLFTAGLDASGQRYFDLFYKHRSADERLSLAIGTNIVVGRDDLQGNDAHSWLLGGTARLSIGARSRLQVFAGEYEYQRDGDYRIVSTSAALPERIARRRFLGQDWARERGQRRIAGALFDSKRSAHWSLGATAVFSQEDPTRLRADLSRGR